MSKLLIVESPSKAKSITKYLGNGFKVMASNGHIRDLPKKSLGVNVDKNFAPKYVSATGKEDLIKQLQAAAAESEIVYLATDPDREGEAIAWHLSQILALDEDAPIRVTFNEITKSGIEAGMSAPRTIDNNLVDAQQARRILDRLVGYKLSPFLWKKVRRGLSAGRVQSVVVRLIVDREEEIKKFVPTEYWSVAAKLSKKGAARSFEAKLFSTANGDKIEIPDEASALSIKAQLENAEYVVKNVKKGTRNCQPSPPFITSTLQQEASKRFNMPGERTMRAAQQLYEGVDIPGTGTIGLITYMRTDSVRISEEARAAANKFIVDTYGEKYLPAKPRYFKTKANAQDGHEAIRPTVITLTPAEVKPYLTPDQYKIYRIIWERFTASLMSACVQDTRTVDIAAADYIFRASGYTVKFDGFTAVYQDTSENEEENTSIPVLENGDPLDLRELLCDQHFTQPPARYNEASLIKVMEESGIGRPSTYAPTIATIIKREYVEREKKTLKPTLLGEVTTKLMKELFKDIVDSKFTAAMEKDLDMIAEGNTDYVDALSKFYRPFIDNLSLAESKMDGKYAKIPDTQTGEFCEKCGKPLVIKSGRFGKFIACSGYPECKTTKAIVVETFGACPNCGSKILEKKSRKGYKYFACEKGQDCGFMTWDTPTADACPNCGKTLFKRRGGLIVCNAEGCNYQQKSETKRKGRAKTQDEE